MASHAWEADGESLSLAGVITEELIDGRYRLVVPLGSLDGADAWRAYDVRLNREVVIELTFSECSHGVMAEQLQALLTQRYSHLQQVYDAGRQATATGCWTFVVTSLLEANVAGVDTAQSRRVSEADMRPLSVSMPALGTDAS